MSNRANVKYTPLGLTQIVVVKDPTIQCPNGTNQNPINTAHNSGGNSRLPTPADQQSRKNKTQVSNPSQQPPKDNGQLVTEEHQHNVGTDLHLASQRLDFERVSVLLEAGADVNAVDGHLLTPLDVAGENIPSENRNQIKSFLDVIKALIAKGGKPTTAKNAKYRETPLHVAVNLACEDSHDGKDCNVCLQCLDAIHILCQAGYDKPLQNKSSTDNIQTKYEKSKPVEIYKEVHTALHAAVLKKWLAGVNLLLEHEADINARVLVPMYRKSGVLEKHRRSETVLHLAVHKQWPEGVDVLLKHGADVTSKLCTYAGGYTPLHMASQRVDIQCTMLLLDAGAEPNALDALKLTALDTLGEQISNKPVDSFLSVMEALIKKGGKPSSSLDAKYRQTPVHVAVNIRCSEAINALFYAGYDRLLGNKSGNTPLHVVAGERMEGLLDVLVALYKDTGLDTKNGLGETALHIAVKKKWFEGVKTLLNSGADITAKTIKQKTVLHLLPDKRNYVIMKELLKHKDSHKIVNERDNSKMLPLFSAILAKHDKCVFLLVDAKADVTLTHGNNNFTVLHSAVKVCHPKILNGLFKHDKQAMDNLKDTTIDNKQLKEATPLHIAAFTNSPKCVEILVANNCNLRAKTIFENKKFTALELATMKGYDKVVEILLKSDPLLVNEPDSMGMMPIHWACIHHHSKAIKVIADAGCDLSAMCVHKGDESKSTAMDLFINRVPGAVDLLEEILDSAITVNKEGIEFDYRILLPEAMPKVKGDYKQLKVLDALVQTGDQVDQGRLFTHPVVETFLRLQWERIRKFYFRLILAFSLLLVFPLNVLVLLVFYYDKKISDFPFWATIMFISMGIGFIIYICHEILYFIFKTKYSKYCCQWTLSRDVIIFILKSSTWVLKIGLICIIVFYPFVNPNAAFSRELAMCAVLLLCLEFMLLISRIPTYGIYMLMFFKVTSNFFVILLSFTLLILGFMTTFLVEFRGEKPFNSISEAFLKTIVMITSEFDYSQLFDNISNDSGAIAFSKIIFLIFLLTVVIVIMNIVLAKAILDVKKVDRLRKQAEFLSTYEQLLLFSNPFLLSLSNLFGPRCKGFMTNLAIESKLQIRFDQANRFHNNLMQSIMKRAYIVTKTKQDSPEKEEATNNANGELTKVNTQLDKLIEMNKLMMDTITSLATKLDVYSQKVDKNTDKINHLSASIDRIARQQGK